MKKIWAILYNVRITSIMCSITNVLSKKEFYISFIIVLAIKPITFTLAYLYTKYLRKYNYKHFAELFN